MFIFFVFLNAVQSYSKTHTYIIIHYRTTYEGCGASAAARMVRKIGHTIPGLSMDAESFISAGNTFCQLSIPPCQWSPFCGFFQHVRRHQLALALALV